MTAPPTPSGPPTTLKQQFTVDFFLRSVTEMRRDHRSPVRGDANGSQFVVRSSVGRAAPHIFLAFANRFRNWRLWRPGRLLSMDAASAPEDADVLATAP